MPRSLARAWGLAFGERQETSPTAPARGRAELRARTFRAARADVGTESQWRDPESLREMGLPDIVQVLFHGRKTGRLNVRSNGKSGEIHFLEGAIANALFGEHTGASAFYQMLKFTEGDFALDPGFTPPARLVEESSEALLLEGMRRMDEGL
jgi:hypothetical protein